MAETVFSKHLYPRSSPPAFSHSPVARIYTLYGSILPPYHPGKSFFVPRAHVGELVDCPDGTNLLHLGDERYSGSDAEGREGGGDDEIAQGPRFGGVGGGQRELGIIVAKCLALSLIHNRP
jgi:hypothetical protein